MSLHQVTLYTQLPFPLWILVLKWDLASQFLDPSLNPLFVMTKVRYLKTTSMLQSSFAAVSKAASAVNSCVLLSSLWLFASDVPALSRVFLFFGDLRNLACNRDKKSVGWGFSFVGSPCTKWLAQTYDRFPQILFCLILEQCYLSKFGVCPLTCVNLKKCITFTWPDYVFIRISIIIIAATDAAEGFLGLEWHRKT